MIMHLFQFCYSILIENDNEDNILKLTYFSNK